MEIKEMKEKTLEILEAAENPADKDAVLSQMFAAGIPFGKLNSLYKNASIEGGFVVDPAVVKDNLLETLDEVDAASTFGDWTEVEGMVDELVEKVEGSTVAQCLRYFKAWCKDNEIDLPKKPKASAGTRVGGLGKVNEAIVDYANSTDEVTPQGMYDAILPNVKGPDNAKYYANGNIVLVLALKKGISGKDAAALVKAMPKIDLPTDAPAVEGNVEEQEM